MFHVPSKSNFESCSKMFVIYLRIVKITINNFQYSQISVFFFENNTQTSQYIGK